MSPSVIDETFDGLQGIPSWQVKQGWGSFLTLEFGLPSQEIYPVSERKSEQGFSHPQRLVVIKGQWHLWIYCCGWDLLQDGKLLAHNESDRETIAEACRVLDGQALTDFRFHRDNGQCRFEFDLGGKLETGPYSDKLEVQWMLFRPDGKVLSFRSDSTFRFSGEEFTEVVFPPK